MFSIDRSLNNVTAGYKRIMRNKNQIPLSLILAGAAFLGAGFTATFGAADLVAAFAAGFGAGFAADFTAALATGFGALFKVLLASALRAAGAAFAAAEDFDFAGVFAGVLLGFEAALAIACTQPARGKGNRAPYTTLGRPAQVEEFRKMKA